MTGVIAHDEAQRLRSAIEGAFAVPTNGSSGAPGQARDALLRVIEVLESSGDAVVLPADALLSTQQAAELLGVSRMTVVRLIDRGELEAEGGGVHRRISAAELERYRRASAERRRTALSALVQDVAEDAPPDRVISTR
ncbi:helix-turn-helix domain-containing protein [Actinomycetaceae bacterium L2_0104]